MVLETGSFRAKNENCQKWRRYFRVHREKKTFGLRTFVYVFVVGRLINLLSPHRDGDFRDLPFRLSAWLEIYRENVHPDRLTMLNGPAWCTTTSLSRLCSLHNKSAHEKSFYYVCLILLFAVPSRSLAGIMSMTPTWTLRKVIHE